MNPDELEELSIPEEIRAEFRKLRKHLEHNFKKRIEKQRDAEVIPMEWRYLMQPITEATIAMCAYLAAEYMFLETANQIIEEAENEQSE